MIHPKFQHLQHKFIWRNQGMESMCSWPLCCNPTESRSIYYVVINTLSTLVSNDWQAPAKCSSGKKHDQLISAALITLRCLPVQKSSDVQHSHHHLQETAGKRTTHYLIDLINRRCVQKTEERVTEDRRQNDTQNPSAHHRQQKHNRILSRE